MHTNLLKVQDNLENLEELENKTDSMSKTAGLFSKNATTLERKMKWRNIKIKVMIGLCVFATVGVIVWYFLKS